jgi:hypothetical protein
MSSGIRGLLNALVLACSRASEQRQENCESVVVIHNRWRCPNVLTRRCLRR